MGPHAGVGADGGDDVIYRAVRIVLFPLYAVAVALGVLLGVVWVGMEIGYVWFDTNNEKCYPKGRV